MHHLAYKKIAAETENVDSVSFLIDKIFKTEKWFNLEIDAEGVIELLNLSDTKIPTDDITELKKESTVEDIDQNFEPT